MTPARPSRSPYDQAGMIGKIALFWIIGLLLVGLLALDAFSIVLTTFKLSNTAQGAASTAATTYKNLHEVTKACEAAQVNLLSDNVGVPQNDTWCKINETTGVATISLHSTASSLVLGRLSFTEDYTKISVKETAEPSSL
jgi:hypothetical protein